MQGSMAVMSSCSCNLVALAYDGAKGAMTNEEVSWNPCHVPVAKSKGSMVSEMHVTITGQLESRPPGK
jgi:hypothetical protein